MRSGFVVLFLALIVGGVGFVIVSQEEKTNLNVNVDEVVIHTGRLNVCFIRGERFEETYMLFGGEIISGRNVIMPLCISGVTAENGIDIASRHTHFWECKSPGASLAQDVCVQLHMVPSRPKIMDSLKQTLKDFKKAAADTEEDRICVKLQGNRLELKSVITDEQEQDVTEQFKSQFDSLDCRLITDAQQLGWQLILERGY